MYSQYCITVTTIYTQNLSIICKTFSSSPTDMCPLNINLLLSSPAALVTSTLFSVSVNLPILGTSYQWNHTILVLLRLTSLDIVFKGSSTYSLYQNCIHFMTSNTPLYV